MHHGLVHLRQCGEMVHKCVHVVEVVLSESENVKVIQDDLVKDEMRVEVEMKRVVVFVVEVEMAE